MRDDNVVGTTVGSLEGIVLGSKEVIDVGAVVRTIEGFDEDKSEGRAVGNNVGSTDGRQEGSDEGVRDGVHDGLKVDKIVGLIDGDAVDGFKEGALDGTRVVDSTVGLHDGVIIGLREG